MEGIKTVNFENLEALEAPLHATEGSLESRTNDVSSEVFQNIAPIDEMPLDAKVVHLNKTISEEAINEMVSDGNFVTRMRELVCQILSQFSQISENDRKQIETMKREYRITSHEASDIHRQIGDGALLFAALGVAGSLSSLMWKTPDNRELVRSIANQLSTGFGTLHANNKQGLEMQLQSLSNLRSIEITNKGQKTGSESNSKGEVLQLLTSVLDAIKKASSAN